MMLSHRGRLLWYSLRPYVARDLKTVIYRGERMLAFYQWRPSGDADYTLLDRHYRVAMRIRPRYGYRTNTHEVQLTPRGTAYVSAYQNARLPSSGQLVTDFVIQEIDLATRDVLFEWHSLDHVPLSASYQPRPHRRYAWDYFHGNSIEPPNGDGTIIVSARNTSAIYGIDRRTGALLWTFGGKRDEFGLVRRHPAQQFCAQHDARRTPDGDLTLFDNGGPALGTMDDCPVHRARVQRFRIEPRARRARLVRTIWSHPSSPDGRGLYAWAVGSAERRPSGNMLIDWGTTGRITEVAPNGAVVLGLRLDYYSYRAARSAWHGLPLGRPAIAVRRPRRDVVRVWASWNGATEIRHWQVLAGRSRDALRPRGPKHRFDGLETAMRVVTGARFVAVRALNSSGAVIGRSATVSAGAPGGRLRRRR